MFSPEITEDGIRQTQKQVNGIVRMAMYKGNCWVTGRHSNDSLYDSSLASMEELGNYDQSDASGFIKIQSVRLRASSRRSYQHIL